MAQIEGDPNVRWRDVPALLRAIGLRLAALIGYLFGRCRINLGAVLMAVGLTTSIVLGLIVFGGVIHGPGWLACYVAGGEPVALEVIVEGREGRIVWDCRGLPRE